MRHAGHVVLAFVGVVLACEGLRAQAQVFSGRLETYVRDVVKLSSAERQRLAGGQPVTKLLESDESKEVAVFGAIWIDAPMQRYIQALGNIETLENGAGFNVTKRISTPPRLDDFAALRLPDNDLNDLRNCRVGKCNVKLGERALQRFQSEIDWRAPDAKRSANALMQRLAFDYVTGYLNGGNAELAVYRDNSRPTFVAQEFASLVERVPALSAHMPDMRRYLLEFPRANISAVKSFLYWQETEFGLKPTIRINHIAIYESDDDTIVASKMIYASHYFWTGLELRVLIPDASRGDGFWLVTVGRSRSDGLSGFTGRLLRGRVRSGAEKAARDMLQSTKLRLERAAR